MRSTQLPLVKEHNKSALEAARVLQVTRDDMNNCFFTTSAAVGWEHLENSEEQKWSSNGFSITYF